MPIVDNCLKTLLPEWEKNCMKLYESFAKNIPPIVNNDIAYAWNGFQLNYFHGAKCHKDINDIPNIPSLIFSSGDVKSPLHVYHNNMGGNYTDIPMQPGSLLFMDSQLSHEVICNNSIEPINKHGKYIPRRIRFVLMANKQFNNYVSQQYSSTVLWTKNKIKH